jgi:catechol 2,3-dioxygenase-like lactoylglutathione lyase family enzyme
MSIGVLEHVLVLADDIDGTRDFYCQVVGLSLGGRPPLAFPGYWLYAAPDGSGPACVHVAERRAYAAHAAELGLTVPDGPDPGVGPVDHIAFNASDYDGLLERLQRRGVRAVTNAVPGGPRQVFIQDPNGVRIEINVSDPKAEAR